MAWILGNIGGDKNCSVTVLDDVSERRQELSGDISVDRNQRARIKKITA